MEVVRAIFNGHDIKPIEPVRTKKTTEVLVIFPNEVVKMAPRDARKLLKGSGKGSKLTEKLLQYRAGDKEFDKR